MRFISRGAFLALLTTLALSAVAVSSAAAAAPEFQKEGKPLAETVKFTSASSTAGIAGEGGANSCKTVMSGETKGSTEVAGVSIKMSCVNNWPCHEIEAKTLKGKLGLIGSKTVGLLVEPTSGYVATCVGGGGPIYIRGSLIGKFTVQLGKSTSKFELEYRGQSGEQDLTHFEGESLTHQLEYANGSLIFHGLSVEYSPTLETAKALELVA
jgi:hypothetical protein